MSRKNIKHERDLLPHLAQQASERGDYVHAVQCYQAAIDQCSASLRAAGFDMTPTDLIMSDALLALAHNAEIIQEQRNKK